jgi:AraC-like DNA-binding protein
MSGQGSINIGSESYVCRPGDVFILRRGTPHEVIVDESAHEFTYFWYNLGGNSLSLLDSFRVPFPPYIANANIESLFRKGIQVVEQAKQLESVQIPIMLVCTEILMTLSKLIIQRSSQLSNQVLKFMTYLDTAGFTALNSKQMSQFFNMSSRHINRIFKSETGSSLYQYVLERKIESARMLLKDTSIPIREIAEKLGFTDQYHFSNFFKKRTGASPMEFRKKEQ